MASQTSQYNHTAWWIGGFAIVALIVGGFYIIYTGALSKGSSSTSTSQSDSKGVGSSAPAEITKTSDVRAAESSLDDTDLDAVTAELDENDADLANF